MSYRSPLPLLVAGVLAAGIMIAVIALPTANQQQVDPATTTTLSDREALTLVAEKVRSGDVAARIMREGKARYEEGAWLITLGDATFHFSMRNRVVVPDNDAAVTLFFQAAR